MAIPGNANLLLLTEAAGAAAAGGKSIRFNSADSAYLSKTFGSAGNRKTWTWAGWVKRSKLGAGGSIFGCTPAGGTDTTYLILQFSDNDQLELEYWTSKFRQTTQVFRDASAWFHVVAAFDTTLSTAADRVKLYINGSQVTSFAITNTPTQNTDYAINSTTSHNIGSAQSYSTRYLNGYLADVYFIDGSSLDPTAFGEFDATTGVWNPIEYTGSYGTNGFHLDFADNSSAAALGYDAAGNNDWTVNNISVTAGVDNDSLFDHPTNGDTANDTGAGGEVSGNYATLNPLANKGVTLANGNLDLTRPSGDSETIVYSTIGISSGKWYAEMTAGGDSIPGISLASAPLTTYSGGASGSYGYYSSGLLFANGSTSSYGASFASGDVIGVALNLDAGTLVFYKNGVSQGTAASGLSGTFVFTGRGSNNSTPEVWNFGQRAFAYTAPSGFKALCTANLPTPTIEDGSNYFDTKLYTGNNSTNTISGLNFSPDFIWTKSRSRIDNHVLHDIVRGRAKSLYSDLTVAENTTTTSTADLVSFDANGYTLGTVQQSAMNRSGETYVAWTWDGGSSTVSNTQGSITSSVRANPTAGFSIVTYTGNGSTGTVGHGLGVAPAMYITKNRSNSTWDWNLYHVGLTSASYVISLNKTDAQRSEPTTWNATSPTSTVFSIGSAQSNNSGSDYVAYCFAPVAGYSSMGSYVGTGSSDGPFVYTGHRSRWLLVKCSSAAGAWILHDTARTTYNVMGNELRPDDSTGEYAVDRFDIVSNGFKVRSSNATLNSSGATYIYCSFAENPFKIARAR